MIKQICTENNFIYDRAKININKTDQCNSENEQDRDIEKITALVNDAVHKIDIYWLMYKSVMTCMILPLKFYRSYINQYDDFETAVKHFYYDRPFTNTYLFINIINSLKNSKSDLENIMPDELFNNVCYPIDRIIDYIENNFLGDANR